ncbi:MAG TPA: hypothetical protein H9912_02680 [Candidatus Eisenbergiella stercorigallinarum]|uniref:Uncharacterized protein n=1 Tax=Candidatus Eisenbergiella stercorigallinarum TaxID=2838557 RepID=A0A9D2R0T6_9FIRM|nr:hypothetical protein [Candidatus Eisenbergiella stercorigallinarum]
MRRNGKRAAALVCMIFFLAVLPAGALQVRAAEVIATVSGEILSGTTEELLLLSTAQGRMEIRLDSETDASACKVLLPGREIYVAVTHGSDGYLHAAKITSSVQEKENTIDYSTSVTVTGEISGKTKEDILYLNTDQGEMQIRLDSSTNLEGIQVLVAGETYQITCARGSDAWLHAVSISDTAPAVVTETINGISVTTLKGTVADRTKDDLLYLSTDGGEMQFVIDGDSDVSNGRVLMPGRKVTVSFYRGSDAYLHAARIVGEKESVSAASVDTSASTAVMGTVDGKSTENTLYLNTAGGTMELRLDSSSSFSNCRVLVKGRQVVVVCARGSDAYMHAVSVIGL